MERKGELEKNIDDKNDVRPKGNTAEAESNRFDTSTFFPPTSKLG